MARLTFKVYDKTGALADAIGVELSDKSASYGIKRTSTGAVIVAAGTALTRTAMGIYTYDWTPPVRKVSYTIWVKAVTWAGTTFHEIIYVPPLDVSETGSSPADIVTQYLLNEAVFSLPSAGGAWPLYNGSLPDGDGVADDCAAIFNTSGVLHGKDLREGALSVHHGLQLRFRSVDERDGFQKAQSIVDFLLTVVRETVTIADSDNYRLQSFTQTTSIIPINVDDKGRTHYTVNLIVSCQKISE